MNDAVTIRARRIDKSFGSTRAVAEASIEVAAGELVALLGPSGSGKTTLLRIVAGFERPDRGTVEVDGRVVADDTTWVEPEQRRVGMVFQDGALFPHLTVGRNVAFGGPAPGRADECLALVGLADRAGSYPHELSGGERQRVALARALAVDPTVVLLDEPFAALDAGLRTSLREEVAGILRGAGASAMLVTHDQQEALSLADRIAVMRDGRVEQTGTPEEVYSRPASRWVAEFLGAAELFSGTITDHVIDCPLGRFGTDADLHGAVEVVVRPESLVISPLDSPSIGGTAEATVVGRTYFGHDQMVRLELSDGRRLQCRASGAVRWTSGARVRLAVAGNVWAVPVAAAQPG